MSSTNTNANNQSLLETFVNVLSWFTSAAQTQPQQQSQPQPPPAQSRTSQSTVKPKPVATSKASTSSTAKTPNSVTSESKKRRGHAPENPIIKNMDALISDILVRYVILKDEDFRLYYRVLDTIFQNLHIKMKEIDPYYNRYSSTVQHAGSHFDNVRINKPDEFDIVIIIGLPLCLNESPGNPNESDIKFEPRHAGYVQLKMGPQFQNLPMRDGFDWQINKTAYSWKDDAHFLQQNIFLDWFKGVVKKGLNQFSKENGKTIYTVDGVKYTILHSQSGPAETLIVKNEATDFYLSVDLVPALKFPETRWPITKAYRQIPQGCKKGTFQVVGKPNKEVTNETDKKRSWRISMQPQETALMHGTNNLRNALRLMKKLRDALEMHSIASYFIKTLFLFEIVKVDDKQYWSRNSPTKLFKIMVPRLYETLVSGKLPYFWNEKHDLLWNVNKNQLKVYAAKLKPLLAILEQPERYKEVAKFLLTKDEYTEYEEKVLSRL